MGTSFFKPPQSDSGSPEAGFRSFSTPPQKQAHNLTAGAAQASEAEALSFPRPAGQHTAAADAPGAGATNLVTKTTSSSGIIVNLIS
jgi:hypothetical protein